MLAELNSFPIFPSTSDPFYSYANADPTHIPTTLSPFVLHCLPFQINRTLELCNTTFFSFKAGPHLPQHGEEKEDALHKIGAKLVGVQKFKP